MALTNRQEIAIERAWGMNMTFGRKVPDIIPSQHRTLIASALRLAAGQYHLDATTSADTPRVADQFTMQADLCEKIAELLDL